MGHFYKEVQCTSAAEFLDYLRLSKDHWWENRTERSDWIFRGQKDAEWGLLPSAWRTADNKLNPLIARMREKLESSYGHEHHFEVLVQGAAELKAIEDFVQFVDEIGHPLPPLGDSLAWQEYVESNRTHPQWFNVESVFALAQHHGVPTRLLDFTREPRVAAFFAGYAAGDSKATYVAVWALNLEHVLENAETKQWLQELNCPRHQFSFLHAQNGCSLFDADADQYFVKHKQWPSLERRIAEDWNYAAMHNPPVQRVTLPVSEIQILNELLWRERVSRAHLMPTHDNITRILLDRWSDARMRIR